MQVGWWADFVVGETFNRVLTRKKYICRYVVMILSHYRRLSNVHQVHGRSRSA